MEGRHSWGKSQCPRARVPGCPPNRPLSTLGGTIYAASEITENLRGDGKMSVRRATKGLSSQVDTHLTFLEAGWKVLYLLA